jgi:hypothetical protein
MRPKASSWAIAGVFIAVIGVVVAIYFDVKSQSAQNAKAAAASAATSPAPTTSSPASYAGHIVEWINSQGPNTSWLVGSDGERYWIPTTTVFHCLVNEGHTDLGPQTSAVLNELPDSGQWASCP